MDQIAEQLKEEILSLQQYIEHTEKRLLATNWVETMLDPFEGVEENFVDDEIKDIVEALVTARNQFSVNGHLADRVDDIIARYRHLVDGDPLDDSEQQSLPARDPSFSPLVLYEDEERADGDTPALAIDDLIEPMSEVSTDDLADVNIDDIETMVNSASDDPTEDDPDRDNTIGDFARAEQDHIRENTLTDRVSSPSDSAPDLAAGNAAELFPDDESPNTGPSDSTPDLAAGNANGLFAQGAPPAPRPQKRAPSATGGKPATKIRRAAPSTDGTAASYDIFAQQIDLDALLLDMGIDIPQQDKIQLGHMRKQKLESRSVAALKGHEAAKGQYVLIPRFSRFIHNGTVYNCTVKNLARTFIAVFADIRDLMQYKTHAFLDNEVPEMGWSLVQAEAPHETLNKNYMEQSQYLRYLATTLGVPSHMVRRRSLVEAVFDIITGRLALDTPLQSKTLDWTATGPSKSDYICVFLSEQGLRLRHLNRTQRNKALGLCPNW